MNRLPFKSILLAGLLTTASIPHAFAFEATEVAERLKELMARQFVELAYDEASFDGDDVVLEGVTARSEGAEGSIELGDLTLQDVSEEADGTFRVDTLALDEFEQREDGLTISMIDITLSGLVLPRDPDSDPFAGMMRYERAEVGRLDVENEEGPLATIENIRFDLFASEDELEQTGTAEAFSLELDKLVESGSTAAVLEELGYGRLTGSMFMEYRWRPSDGRMTLSRYEAVIDDAGTLSLMLDFAGYTPEFLRTLWETGEDMEDTGVGGGMQGMVTLGLLSEHITFNGASVRFTDNSLTGKLLDYQARQQGTSPDALISQIKAIIPMQLTPVTGAELAGDFAQEVGAFLENPGNIEISARPENPVPFSALVGALMMPGALGQQMGLSVTANQ